MTTNQDKNRGGGVVPSKLMFCGFILLTSVWLQAAAPEQHSFATPQQAINALIDACEHNDTAGLLQIFGSTWKDIAQSGDPAEDQSDRAEFARKARQKVVVNEDSTDKDHATFSIGEEEWQFPVPLVHRNGSWVFDSSKGRVEILAHRIGENELDTIEVCRGFAEAQLDFAAKDHDHSGILQYAQRIASLRTDDLVPESFAKAMVGDPSNPRPEPYHGYFFRILKEQGPNASGGAVNYIAGGKMIGGFALIAWPVEYGASGIQTFILNHQGIVYAKDLGPTTSTVAAGVTRFDPDKSWHSVELE
jgi:hypothetical protein